MADIEVRYDERSVAGFRSQGYWRGETLPALIQRHVTEEGARPAILASQGIVTYAQLWTSALRLAGAFERLKVARGDVIAVQLPNCTEFLVTYLAAGLCGAVFQPIHMAYRAAELRALLAHSAARVAVSVSAVKDYAAGDTLRQLRGEIESLRHLIVVGPPVDETLSYSELLMGDVLSDVAAPGAADPYLLLYTSGTTAAPKAVPVIYDAFLSNARMVAGELSVSNACVLLSAAPFTHLYGLFTIHLAWSAGAAIALQAAFTPPGLIARLKMHRPTGLFVAPAHLAACRSAGLLDQESLASLRFVMISGSTCPPHLAEHVQQLMPDGKVLQLWGMSELQAGAFTRPNDELAVRTASVGRASPGTALRIVRSDGRAAEPDEAGELQVKGCSVFSGYHAGEGVDARAFTADSWFRTGDLATMDERGNLRITGRLKELINRGGVKINPVEVEAVLDAHPAILQSAIVPMPDPVLGERACCFVVLKPHCALSLDDVRLWLQSHAVSKVKWPERLECVAALPMTPTRKIRRGDLVKSSAELIRDSADDLGRKS